MSRKLKKALLTALKFAIAAVLLGWVLSERGKDRQEALVVGPMHVVDVLL